MNRTRVLLAGLDFNDAQLAFGDLSALHPSCADFFVALLTGANFADWLLTGADLRDALLTGADLRNPLLTGANLRNPLLIGANFADALLTGAYLAHANLLGANLTAQAPRAPNPSSALLYFPYPPVWRAT